MKKLQDTFALPVRVRLSRNAVTMASTPLHQLRVSASAQNDIDDILSCAQTQFGRAARLRYEKLLIAALTDLRKDPKRPGVKARPDIGRAVSCYHLSMSRKNTTASTPVSKPRHIVFFRSTSTHLDVARVLHEAMDVDMHAI